MKGVGVISSCCGFAEEFSPTPPPHISNTNGSYEFWINEKPEKTHIVLDIILFLLIQATACRLIIRPAKKSTWKTNLLSLFSYQYHTEHSSGISTTQLRCLFSTAEPPFLYFYHFGSMLPSFLRQKPSHIVFPLMSATWWRLLNFCGKRRQAFMFQGNFDSWRDAFPYQLLFSAKLKPRDYYLEHVWQASWVKLGRL